MQKVAYYSILFCALIFSGCNLLKGPDKVDSGNINPGIHNKVMLTVQGPADAENLNNLSTAIAELEFVLDVSIVDKTGVVTVCIVPGATYDILRLQKASLAVGYRVLKAGEITW